MTLDERRTMLNANSLVSLRQPDASTPLDALPDELAAWDKASDEAWGNMEVDDPTLADAILARLADDALVEAVGRKCEDPDHDDRACPTCEARLRGIDDYRRAVQGET